MSASKQQTLAIIKPDAVAAGKADEIKELIQKNGFEIVKSSTITLTKERAGQFYQEHQV